MWAAGALAIVGVIMTWRYFYIVRSWSKATGRVVAHRLDPFGVSSTEGPSFHWDVEFSTQGGQRIRITSQHSKSDPPKIGTDVVLRYDPADPRTTMNLHGYQNFANTGGWFVVSLFCFGIYLGAIPPDWLPDYFRPN